MLKITGDGRKAALDMRLVDPFAETDGDTKLSRAVEQIIPHMGRQTSDKRSTQLVFCDLSTPNPDTFQRLRRDPRQADRQRRSGKGNRLSSTTPTATPQKKTLFDAVNAGRVRILLGSTEKMGAGTNVQKRLVALHHLDAPWRPRDIEQREGRILRQGNRQCRGPDLPLRHRRLVRRLYVADAWKPRPASSSR